MISPLYEGSLDADGVAALLRDIEVCPELVEVRIRAQATTLSSEAPHGVAAGSPGAGSASLAAVAEALTQGRLAAAQLVYRHDGALWVDTLMTRGAQPGGARVVRSRTPEDEAPCAGQ